MNALSPAEYHADLTEDRLLQLAQFFASTRNVVADLHDSENGDDSWSLGCRAFARCRNLLSKKAQQGEWDWLRIISSGKRFIFAIGSVPVRFYRGDPANPPVRTLAQDSQELMQLAFAFAQASDTYKDLKWRFAIETNYRGIPISVTFAGMASENGSVVCSWKLPFDLHEIDFDLDVQSTDDMVELAAPLVVAPSGLQERSRGE